MNGRQLLLYPYTKIKVIQLICSNNNLRNPRLLDELKTKNKYDEMQFKNIYIKIKNIIGLDNMNLNIAEFKNYLVKNMDVIYIQFIQKF
jgi:hypothetical protein